MNLLNNKFVKYVIFAIITSLLNVGTYMLFYNLIIKNVIVSNVAAYAVSITSSFFINKKVVFKNDNTNLLEQMISYLGVKAVSFAIDSFVLILFVDIFGFNNFISKLIANASTTISNYTLNNKVVFKNKEKNI